MLFSFLSSALSSSFCFLSAASPDLAALQLLLAGGGQLEPHVRAFLALMHCSKWTMPRQPTA
jgi:hypothetical protein